VTIVYTFLKVVEKVEYAEQFRRGLLHMNTVRYFREYQDDNGILRGDEYEGVTGIWQPSQFSKVIIRGIPVPATELARPILMHTEGHLDWHVFCLYALSNKGYENGASFETLGDLNRAIQLNEKCFGLGPLVVLVTKPQEFLARVRVALEKLNCNWRINLIEYYDETTFHGEFADRDVPFRKRRRYEAQREYRIAFQPSEMPSGPFTLDVGDLSDATTTMPTDKLNEVLSVSLPDGTSA
jgi:hypothetical protein